MKSIQFRRLIKIYKPEEYHSSLIVIGRRPYEQRVIPKYYTLDFAEQPTHITYVSKYKYVLGIDLWLVRLRFVWVGRERRAP